MFIPKSIEYIGLWKLPCKYVHIYLKKNIYTGEIRGEARRKIAGVKTNKYEECVSIKLV
jgi:hypothetical protein